MKYRLIKYSFIVLFVAAIIMILSTADSNNTILKSFSILSGVRSNNLLKNAYFKENQKNWEFTNNAFLIETNNLKLVHIKGNDKNQERFWQSINVISGVTYRLSFELSGPSVGAFIILMDKATGKENYYYCNEKNVGKIYVWQMYFNKSIEKLLLFSTYKNGDFYYSNIDLYKYNYSLEKIYKTLSITIFVLIAIYLIRFNFLFVSIILLFMISPIVKFNKDKVSQKEKRALSIFKPLLIDNKINTSFGIDFNNWINDHFWGRYIIINNYNRFFYSINQRAENSKAIQGKDGWLFEKFNPDLFKPINDIDKILIRVISSLQKTCKDNNIYACFASIPEKNSIYKEYLFGNNISEELSDILSKNKNINFISLYEILFSEKNNDFVFFKDDHHWTQYGAYVSFNTILNKITTDFSSIKTIDKSIFIEHNFTNTYNNEITFKNFTCENRLGSIYYILNLQKYYFKTLYKYFTIKNAPSIIAEFPEKYPYYTIYKNGFANNKLKIMIVGDSNIGFMIPFVYASFEESLFLQINDVRNNWSYQWNANKYNEILLDYKPDILLCITRSSNLQSWIHILEKQ